MKRMFLCFALVVCCLGCVNTKGNVGRLQSYPFQVLETEWIRNGEPIEFENGLWYPQDDVEVLQDSEMILMGDYRGVQYFIHKFDVRPFRRLYTKFGPNKYRFFEKL